jgi:hypothetical protein
VPRSLGAEFDRSPVMLLASLPVEPEEGIEFERSLEIQEAVLSFGRAAFSRGHPVVVPADGFAAPLLAAVATEYRAPARSEETRRTPPQLAIGLFGGAEEERAGWPGRAVPPGVLRERFESFADFLRSVEPRKVIVVGGGVGESEEERVLRFEQASAWGVEMQVVGPTLTNFAREQGWYSLDATQGLLAEIEWPERGGDRREDGLLVGAEGLVPYAYLMQRLLETDDEEGVEMVAGGHLRER